MDATKILACLTLAASSASYVQASDDFTFTPSLSIANFEYTSGGNKNDGQLALLGLEFETEDKFGNWHRFNVERSIYDDSSYTGDLWQTNGVSRSSDDTKTEFEYRIGRYLYPAGDSDDLEMWTGIGYQTHEYDVKGSAGYESIRKRIYIPAGIEYGTPADSSGAWVNGKFRHENFLFYGAQFNWLVSGTHTKKLGDAASGLPTVHLDQDGGYGYSVWFGWDMVLNSGNVFQTKLTYEAWEIDKSEQDEFTNGGTLYQVSEASSSESSWTLTFGYRM